MKRLRNLRSSSVIRDLLRENELSLNDLIYPIFVHAQGGDKQAIASMPGQFRHSIDSLQSEISEITDLGIKSIILFGLPESKDAQGSSAWDANGIVQQAIKAVKSTNKDMHVISDVCLCQYTDHGHCGLIEGHTVLNDVSVEVLAKIALSHAQAGADMIAPSDMMDGRVAAIRYNLDSNGFEHLPIMSYAVKYASAFYGPFREAADGAPEFGDRSTYQMDVANSREAMLEMEQDVKEGSDILMIKPALVYLDLVAKAKEKFNLPVACYNVSGEYAMIKAADEKGWIDGSKVMLESLLSMKRAGADLILTYFAKDAAKLLKQ